MSYITNIFVDVSNATGLTYDQAKFALTLFACFPLGMIFRTCFHVRRVSAAIRHCISILCGFGLILLCFGREAFHLVALSLIGYLLMCIVDQSNIHRYIFVTAITYLSIIHVKRMFIEDGYVIEISGPLMIATMKLISVGFNIYDKNQEKHKKDSTHHSIWQPSLLGYLSYMLCFNNLMCGPPPEYDDHIEFIEETYLEKYKKKDEMQVPTPLGPAITKLVFGYSMVACYAVLAPYYIPSKLGDEERLSSSSLLSNMIFAEMVLYLMKAKYYSAFLIGESACNISGLGFNGYDVHGNALWNKLQNVRPYNMEVAQSVRDLSQSWNVVTGAWLKRYIYNRVSYHPLLATWFFSSFWHGFYPGYYMFFLPMGVAVFIGRKLRRLVRPYFLRTAPLKLTYDVLTLILTRLVLNFYSAGFTMMDMKATLRFWRGAYYYGHVILATGLVLVLVLPNLIGNKKESFDTNTVFDKKQNGFHSQ